MTNVTLTNDIPLYDTCGSAIYIIGVIVWYAIGFGLILIDNINSKSNCIGKHQNVYQVLTDLREQKIRNDILIELKDQDRRRKLWEIYYGTNKNASFKIEKEKHTVDFIIKQLNELAEQLR